MADGPWVIVTGRRLLSPFRTLLQRLSLEIQQDQLESMKFLLEDSIPLGILETCHKPRDLFSCMLKTCLLGENNLDLLEELLSRAQRSDLAECVKDFRKSISTEEVVDAPGEQINRELPGMGKAMVYFLLSGKMTDFNQKDTLEPLKVGISAALHVKGYEICFVRREVIEANNWFAVIFQIPNKAEVLNTLRHHALCKEDWLQQCGIKAVKIGKEAYIFLVQPITLSLSKNVATQTSISHLHLASSFAEMPSTSFNVQNLDLIVVVERHLDPDVQIRLNTQLAHMVNMSCVKNFNFRLALVCYTDHTTSLQPNAHHSQWLTKDKGNMKTCIHRLPPSESTGSSHGLADGLALALKLASNNDGDDSKCRKDANKVCILLREYGLTDSLDIYNCAHGHDVIKICRQLAENAVTLYTVGISQSNPSLAKNPLADFFAGISLKTGGRYIETPDVRQLPGIAMCVIKEDVSLERLIGTAHDIVLEEVTRKYRDVNVDELSEKLKAALISRSCHASLMQINGVNIPSESELAQKLSYDEDFGSACITFEQSVIRMQRSAAATAGIPGDVNMEEMASLDRVSVSNNHEITIDLSERLVRKVGHRSTYSTSS
ncbi:uncharacterized protein LOC144631506 isoform X2 [Oculina patagonica]